ncbi:electron transfer flavoprotein subunit beta/FixA family protein [Oceanimonas baumannii]|uniref:Electron transfer flavoprotein subunit beta n=1 Tax=Oceanimonas baumannii TaxID=129578 RepID=A0A235CM53_9GAMM|nr:electron transfer flavoprotein subunit beta/FixA family protein [Oceanimonas baumannii]OYD25454.1 electron transporter RnfB [Oceanimonas baumannii]TDW61348.1 electron transfer flavoprotein beta subunit [Oceanimonas baumannii]
MKALVTVKRVIDYHVRVRVLADGSNVDLSNVKMAANPFCEIAVEEAVRMKEKGWVSEIVAVSIGPGEAAEQLRAALALGADRAILVETAESAEPLTVARLLAALCEREAPDLVLMGKQSIDTDHNQAGQMLAALNGWPQATFASAIEQQGDELLVTREVDGGLRTQALRRPAVITTDLRLNEPRFASLPNIMKARQKPLDRLTPDELGVAFEQHVCLLGMSEPPARKAGVRVADVDELVNKLKHEAKVIP